MDILQDRALWEGIFRYSIYCAVLYIAAVGTAIILKNKRVLPEEETQADVNLLQIPKKEMQKPFVPHVFTMLGVGGFFLVFGCCGYVIIGRSLEMFAVLIVSVCLGLVCEVILSLYKYSVDLRMRRDLLFVPNMIHLPGVVAEDIPANQIGHGQIRVRYKGKAVQIRALSMDEVILTRGTAVRIIYADSDRVVVVERQKTSET